MVVIHDRFIINEKQQQEQLEHVYTAHFTVCGKPEWCHTLNPLNDRLCSQLMQEWHNSRLSLEMEWMKRFSLAVGNGDDKSESSFLYVPELKGVYPTESREKHIESHKMGHCVGNKYIPLRLPATSYYNINSENETPNLI